MDEAHESGLTACASVAAEARHWKAFKCHRSRAPKAVNCMRLLGARSYAQCIGCLIEMTHQYCLSEWFPSTHQSTSLSKVKLRMIDRIRGIGWVQTPLPIDLIGFGQWECLGFLCKKLERSR